MAPPANSPHTGTSNQGHVREMGGRGVVHHMWSYFVYVEASVHEGGLNVGARGSSPPGNAPRPSRIPHSSARRCATTLVPDVRHRCTTGQGGTGRGRAGHLRRQLSQEGHALRQGVASMSTLSSGGRPTPGTGAAASATPCARHPDNSASPHLSRTFRLSQLALRLHAVGPFACTLQSRSAHLSWAAEKEQAQTRTGIVADTGNEAFLVSILSYNHLSGPLRPSGMD